MSSIVDSGDVIPIVNRRNPYSVLDTSALVYPRERTLGAITLVLGIIVWIALIVGTFGLALLLLLAGFVVYLFVQSGLISYIKGNGVELTPQQFPDLHAQFAECCARLQMPKPPRAYVLNGDGGMNAFATRFLGLQYVALLSEVVDAMAQHADGVRFYIGHELGHLRMKHLTGRLLRWPVLWLPVLGGAYARARESTCDRHGLACSKTPEGAARALAALAAGSERWKDIDLAAYRDQVRHTRGFWMSFHELLSGYPWLTKRVARVMNPDAPLPRRNPFAYLPAAFIPYTGGGLWGFLVLVYVVAVGVAVGAPAYQDYTIRAEVERTLLWTEDLRAELKRSFEESGEVPPSLESLGFPTGLADGSELYLDSDRMILTVVGPRGAVHFVPLLDDDDRVFWVCEAGEGYEPAHMPVACRP